MTAHEFSKYLFSCFTQVKYQEKWYRICAIDFSAELVEIGTGWIGIEKIQGIKEVTK